MSTAPTGAAAFAVGGSTWQRVLGKGYDKAEGKLTDLIVSKLTANLEGLELFILDEVSLVSLADLSQINMRLQTLASVSCDPSRQARAHLPFGGYHIIVAGDYYQLTTFSGDPLWKPTPKTHADTVMQDLWRRSITHYNKLTRNYRAMSDPEYAAIMGHARAGTLTDEHLATANTRVCNSVGAARSAAKPAALWVTATHKRVNEFNASALSALGAAGAYCTRVIAQHRPTAPGSPAPTEAQLDRLFGVSGGFKSKDTHMPTYIDYAVGQRVRLLGNSCVELGLFQGAMGTIRYAIINPPTPHPRLQRPTIRHKAHGTY